MNLRNRWVLITLSVIYIVLTSGIIFGWPALSIVLQNEGQYAELCKKDSSSDCPARQKRFSDIFTTGAISIRFASLPLGFALDLLGPRLTLVSATTFITFGLLLFGFSDSQSFDAFLPAIFFLGFFGSIIQNSQIHTSNLFIRRPLVVSTLAASFSASGWIFPLFKLMSDYGASRDHIFIGYAVGVFTFIVLTGWVFDYDKPFAIGASLETMNHSLKWAREHKDKSLDFKFMKLVATKKFMLLTIALALNVLKNNLMLGTINSQLSKVDSNASQYVQILMILSPGIAVIMTPVCGYLIHKGKAINYLTIAILSTIYSAIYFIPNLIAQISSFLIFSITNPLVFASFLAFVAEEFGFTSYGRLIGTANFIAGCVGLLQFLVSYVTFEVLGGDFIFLNIFNLAICFPTFFVAWSFGNEQTKVAPTIIVVKPDNVV